MDRIGDVLQGNRKVGGVCLGDYFFWNVVKVLRPNSISRLPIRGEDNQIPPLV